MTFYIPFALWFLAAEAALTAAWLPFRRKRPRGGARAGLIAGKALGGIACAALVMAGPVILRPAQPFLFALYAVLLADAAADLLYAAYCALRDATPRAVPARILGLVCGLCLLVYGIVNMQVVTPRYREYTSEKLTQPHTLAYLSDLHVGSAQPFSTAEKTVRAVLDAAPDCVILDGDLVDDYTTKEEMERFFALFSRASCPVYYVYGNHDRQPHAQYAGGQKFTAEELERAMTDNGVEILRDSFASPAPDLLLLGREDLSAGDGRAAVGDLVNPAPEKYLVVADHQPAAFRDNLALGTDLQLSGHTHAGQLFPLGLLYGLFGYNYGEYRADGAVMCVSAGACGWRVPLRTEAHCEYEIVRLKPAR